MIYPHKEVERVITAPDYIKWKEKNPKSYLCSLFCIQDQELIEDNVWQVSFYVPEKDKITTFTLPVDKRKKGELLNKDAKIFKQKGEIVEELKLNKVKLNDIQALKATKDLLKEKYPHEKDIKEILLLQYNKDIKKVVWNITLMTSALNVFNTKIDATNGEALDYSLRSALELRKEMENNEE